MNPKIRPDQAANVYSHGMDLVGMVCAMCTDDREAAFKLARTFPLTVSDGDLLSRVGWARWLTRVTERSTIHLKALAEAAEPKPPAKLFMDMTEPELKDCLNSMARALEGAAETFGAEKPQFAIVVFNDPKVGQYVGNCERATMIHALKTAVARMEKKEDVPR